MSFETTAQELIVLEPAPDMNNHEMSMIPLEIIDGPVEAGSS